MVVRTEPSCYTMSNEFSTDGTVKIVYGLTYKTYEKYEDEPGQINVFETKDEFFGWTEALAGSCQAVVANAKLLMGDVGTIIPLGLVTAGIVSRAYCDAKIVCSLFGIENPDLERNAVELFFRVVVDDRTGSGRELGDMGKHYDMLKDSMSELADIFSEHIDIRPWLESGEDLRKAASGELMTQFFDYYQENRGKTELAKVIEQGLNLNEMVIGQKYVEYDGVVMFESVKHPIIQEPSGFRDAIDSLGSALGMDIDEAIVIFTEGGYEYRIELWKGSYGFGGATGAEIGVYRRPEEKAKKDAYVLGEKNYYIQYPTVPEENYCEMSYTLYDNKRDQEVFTRDMKNDSQEGDTGWWPLSMRPGYVSDKEDLEMRDVTITLWSEGAADAFGDALEERNTEVTIEERNKVDKIRVEGKTVTFNW